MKSLRMRVLLSFLGTFLVMGVVFSIGLSTYVEQQYYNQKIEKMVQTGNQIRTQLQIAGSDNEARESLDYLGYRFEGRITLLDIRSDRAWILYENQRYIYNRGKLIKEIRYGEHTAFIINTDYPVTNSLWLGYLSQMDDSKFALLEIPVPTIDETLDVFRSYIWKALIFGFFISVAVSFMLARSITTPIAELNRLAKKIGQLEFDSSYQGRRSDEIGQLGSTLNEITKILRNTIESLQMELSKKSQLEKLRKRFVAQVSHELQTPISIISSYTEALSDGLTNEEEQAEYYEIILDECQKMSKVVKDLLDLSGLESGLAEYRKEWLNLEEFLRNLIKKQEWIVKAEGKAIMTSLCPALVYADSFRLEQAIGNILTNSIKHARKQIRVDLQSGQTGLMLRIGNDGDLIDSADIPYIWDSFYKGKNKKAGTGLGLAIASEILKAHKIKYRVYNDDNNKEVIYELLLSQEYCRENTGSKQNTDGA